jgi:hypothetical protein
MGLQDAAAFPVQVLCRSVCECSSLELGGDVGGGVVLRNAN